MKNRIAAAFAALERNKQKALVVYLTGGDPDPARSLELFEAVADAGADILEIGVPFSDPLADGPTIQAAAGRAIAAGTTVPGLLELVARFRSRRETPIVLFTYLNPIYAYGFQKFQRDAVAAGADGILILDLPPEESARNSELESGGLQSIRLVAPTTPEARMRDIVEGGQGFVYYVSREGVTGEQTSLATAVGERVAMVRRHTTLPVVVGFGISNPDQAAAAAAPADGAVIGSAIVRRVAEWSHTPDLPRRIAEFVRPLAERLHQPAPPKSG